MNIIIHRGTHQIGGSCIELKSANVQRIILDLGLPLDTPAEEKNALKKSTVQHLLNHKILPDVKGLYVGDTPQVSAVFISHYHMDHYGLLSFVHPDIPIYMSAGTKSMIECSYFFEQTGFDPQKVRLLKPWKEYSFGDYTIRPYLVDHSAFDAFAYEITCDGKKVFYTGDLRAHGRKTVLFEKLVKTPPKNIDYFIVEGTQFGRGIPRIKTEKDMEKELVKYMRKNSRLTLVSCSSQNIDHLVSIYKACVITGKTFVIDPYTAYMLDKARESSVSKSIPQFDWKNIKVFFSPKGNTQKIAQKDIKKLYMFKSAKITLAEMLKNKENLIIKDSYMTHKILNDQKALRGAGLIYAQYSGYLDKEVWQRYGVEVTHIHTSGHAYVADLMRLHRSMRPKKTVPVHTEHPASFSKVFYPVLELKDGEGTAL